MGKEAEKFTNKVFKKVGKTIHNHELIRPEDKLLAAISGGKDSLVMLECLANRKRSLPFDFKLIAAHVHIHNVGYESNVNFLNAFCAELHVPLHVLECSLPVIENVKKSPCFICSWHRRKKIFELSRNLDCNKIAFGHHMEDALETMLMNMMYHGSISSLPQKLTMFDGRVEVIRPLLNTYEDDIETFASFRNYPKQIKSCPYEDLTKRNTVRGLLEQLHQAYDKSKLNMFRSMDNIYLEYLPKKTLN